VNNSLPETVAYNAGGAINVRDGDTTQGYLRLMNSRIEGNHAPRGGGIMVRSNGGCDLYNNFIVGNTSNSHISGLWILPPNSSNTAPYVIAGNTIANNRTLMAPGTGLSLGQPQNVVMNNNIIAHNGGGGVQAEFNADVQTMSCNLLFGLNGSVRLAEGVTLDPAGYTVADPRFCDLAAGDYHVSSGFAADPAVSGCDRIGVLGTGCTLEPMDAFLDVAANTSMVGVHDTRSVAWGDADNDGDADLYLVNKGAANQLLRNDGDGLFTDVTTPPLDDAGSGMAASWGDFDNDGLLDLFIVNETVDNVLLHNTGDLAFTPVTTIDLVGSELDRDAVWTDFDLDGWLDLYVSGADGPNKLFQGSESGDFSNVAPPLTPSHNTMGTAWGDFDNDGDQDLYICVGDDQNQLLRNDMYGVFTGCDSSASGHRLRQHRCGLG
jgi:hypothetical protein